jgi:hypothetical protein
MGMMNPLDEIIRDHAIEARNPLGLQPGVVNCIKHMNAELAALRERAAGLEDKISSLTYDIRCAVAHSNRAWCVEHTKKHFPMLLAALAPPADAKGAGDEG